MTTAASQAVLGDPDGKDANGKMDQGMMNRKESTSTQNDWMKVGFAQKALELGVSYTPDWASPNIDQKKYQELKKKNFDKLEGGEKLEVMKYELTQKLQSQPAQIFNQQTPALQYQQLQFPQPVRYNGFA